MAGEQRQQLHPKPQKDNAKVKEVSGTKPESRPPIPREIKLAIQMEAGDRCAICGEASPLEIAHIVPWHRVREHKADNLICLCANCHRRADAGKWSQKKLQLYKRRPFI